MRKLKFRIWNKRKAQWVIFNEFDKSECILLGQDGNLREHYYSSLDFLMQEHFVIQQFTGFQDENKRDIYEGDIISCSEPMPDKMPDYFRPCCVVIWDGCSWTYSLDKERVFKNPHQILRYAKDLKVIGNIFSNPELLN